MEKKGTKAGEKEAEKTAPETALTARQLQLKKKKAEKQAGIPVYLAVFLLIFGLAAGAVIYSVYFVKPAVLPDGSANRGTFEEIPIEIKLIYNSDCNICLAQSSLGPLLQQRQLKFSVEALDMKKIDIGVLAGNYGMKTFPSMLVNWKQLKIADPGLFKLLSQLFETNGDYLVIAEADLMKQTRLLSPVMFLEPPVKDACGVKAGTTKITAFFDFLSEQSYLDLNALEKIKQDFNSVIDINEKIFPLSELSKTPAMAAECARQQGKFPEFKKALFSELFENAVDITDFNELKNIALKLGLPDTNAFNACLDQNKTMQAVESGAEAANNYKLAMAPSFVIDCIYTMPGTKELGKSICAFHPDFNACKTVSQ